MDDSRNTPATKGDIEDLRAELQAEMKAMEERIVEAFRDAQTEVLKAFYSFASSNDQRVAQIEGGQVAMNARLGTLESRVTQLERKVNFPNQ